MKTQNFTPGPWITQSKQKATRYRKTYEHGETITILGRHNSYFGLAEVSGPCNFDMQNEMRANASLIAAAPEMFEALEEMLKVFEPSNDLPVITKASTALQKAKGK